MAFRILFSSTFLISLVFLLSAKANAQTADVRENQFNIWNSFEVSKEFGKRLELSVSPQIRYAPDQIKKYFGQADLQYKLSKIFRVGGAFRYEQNKKKSEGYKNIQRYSFNIKASKKIGDFKPAFRLRYTNDQDFEDIETTERIRYKFEVNYNIPKSKFEPEIVWEIFQEARGLDLVKHRIGTSMKYKMSKRSAINAAYLLDYGLDKSRNIHILALKLQFEI